MSYVFVCFASKCILVPLYTSWSQSNSPSFWQKHFPGSLENIDLMSYYLTLLSRAHTDFATKRKFWSQESPVIALAETYYLFTIWKSRNEFLRIFTNNGETLPLEQSI